MQDAITQYIRGAFTQQAGTGKAAQRAGAKLVVGGAPPAGIYPCKPGGPNDWVYVFCLHPEHWRRLATVIGRPELADDQEYLSRDRRLAHADEVDAMIEAWTRQHTKQEAMQLIGTNGVPAGAVLDTADLLAEPSFETRGILQTMQHPSGTLKMPTFPVRFDGATAPVKPSPLLGEHTTEVLGSWLDLSQADVAALKSDGVL